MCISVVYQTEFKEKKIYFMHRTIFCFVSFLKDSGRANCPLSLSEARKEGRKRERRREGEKEKNSKESSKVDVYLSSLNSDFALHVPYSGHQAQGL